MAKIQIKDILTNRPNHESRFIPDYKELKDVVRSLKKMGYRIVLTMGVYDLIHEGHALYLEAARNAGDILIVGADTDSLTKKRKGPNRPIVPESERVKMLVHLRSVDIVTLRREPLEKNELVKIVSPDILIVSETTGDFAKKRLADCKNYVGEIVTLPAQATTSTTARIRNLTIEGAEDLANEVSKLTKNFLDKIRAA
ncbi:MAG: adenylyltransferase/cytidyltransferase family protein [Patescibacteria group bacterium]